MISKGERNCTGFLPNRKDALLIVIYCSVYLVKWLKMSVVMMMVVVVVVVVAVAVYVFLALRTRHQDRLRERERVRESKRELLLI